MVMGFSCQVVLKIDWIAHVSFSCRDLYMGWAGSADFVVELFWAWSSLQK